MTSPSSPSSALMWIGGGLVVLVVVILALPADKVPNATPVEAGKRPPSDLVALADGKKPATPGTITRAMFGDAWPLTVDEGTLQCRRAGEVIFTTTAGASYAVNGTAKGAGYQAIDPIWTTQADETFTSTVTRLTEAERRSAFAASVACEDQASKMPLDGPDFAKQIDAQRAFEATCKKKARNVRHLTESEATNIDREGAARVWPPLTPLRKDIGPLIKAGLALCEK